VITRDADGLHVRIRDGRADNTAKLGRKTWPRRAPLGV